VSERHDLPRPSIWPVTLALGVSMASAGVVTHWLVVVSGALLSVLALAGWIADAARGEG
jgi:hypothetical protein